MLTRLVCVGVECDGWLSFVRAGGDCVCEDCGEIYYKHPRCANSGLPAQESYVLRVLCDGRHVKL
jgi:hypothetical protein